MYICVPSAQQVYLKFVVSRISVTGLEIRFLPPHTIFLLKPKFCKRDLPGCSPSAIAATAFHCFPRVRADCLC